MKLFMVTELNGPGWAFMMSSTEAAAAEACSAEAFLWQAHCDCSSA